MRPAIAHIRLDHLRHNYHLLKDLAGDARVMAVIKANAYGHGLKHVGLTLWDEGCRNFAVTYAEEGCELRQILQDRPANIVLLSGLFDLADAKLAAEHLLTPVITEASHIQELQTAGFDGAVWVKIDTGMQRLGASHAQQLIAQCADADIELAGIMSHLACADEPNHPLNQVQTDAFSHLYHQFKPQSASLLNSAGLITLPDAVYDIVRPGIALYGAEPVPSQPIGLKPVMQLTAQVMQVRTISAGTSISYGATFTAEHDMSIATVCLGYADGLPRGLSGLSDLSNQRQVVHKDHLYNIVGRVCMDYCLLDCTDQPLTRGDMVEFWGESLRPEIVADQLGTIPYTLFTGVGQRVSRLPVY